MALAPMLRGGELQSKIREYEQFANDVLKSDLQKTVELRSKYQLEIEELQQLQRNIQHLQENQQQELKSKVELGSGVFCRAHVPDTSHIYISIGLGFHLEATLEEAHRVIQLKLQTLQAQVDKCVDKAARIKANLKFVAHAIHELMELPS